MSHFAEDVHRKTSVRLRQLIPDFVEADYPNFLAFLEAYYEFLEQYDNEPIEPRLVTQTGTVTLLTGSSTVAGGNTTFSTLSADQQLKIGTEYFTIGTVVNNTVLLVTEAATKSYISNTFQLLANVTIRQASGAIRQVLQFGDIEHTLDDFVEYFRDTYLREVPQGESSTAVLLPKILEFYRSRGSEHAYRFLFRALFNREIDFYYPREDVMRLSDGNWQSKVMLKVDIATGRVGSTPLTRAMIDGMSLPRNIRGLTSNATVTVTEIIETYEATYHVAELHIDESTLEGTFVVGETVSSEPVGDPLTLTATLLGVVTGVTVNEGGTGYEANDSVEFTSGALGGGGFGAAARVKTVANGSIVGLTITNPGDGYYVGLDVDSTDVGTGGSGFEARVSRVTAGALLLNDTDGSLTDAGDNIVLVGSDLLEYNLEHEAIDYYLIPSTTIQPYLGEILNDSDWALVNGNTSDPMFGISLSSTIETVLNATSRHDLMIDGVQTEVGSVAEITVESNGTGYNSVPPLSIELPVTSPLHATPNTTLTQYVPYLAATVEAVAGVGQVRAIEVTAPGAGYSAAPTAKLLLSGDGNANLTAVIGTVARTPGEYVGTNGWLSANKYLQDLSTYQPYTYMITVDENLEKYRDVVKRLLHPAGARLLARRTIESVGDLSVDIVGSETSRSLTGIDNYLVLSANAEVSVSTLIQAFVRVALNIDQGPTGIRSTLAWGTNDLIYPYKDDLISLHAGNLIYLLTYNASDEVWGTGV